MNILVWVNVGLKLLIIEINFSLGYIIIKYFSMVIIENVVY